MIFWFLRSSFEGLILDPIGYIKRHPIRILTCFGLILFVIILVVNPVWIQSGFKNLVLLLIGSYIVISVGAFALFIVLFIYKLLGELILSPRNFMKHYKHVIYFIIGFILLVGFVFVLNPVWNGIVNGLKEVWHNIQGIWVIHIIEDILFYLVVFVLEILFWLFSIFASIFLGHILGTIPIVLINSIISRFSDENPIPVDPYTFQKNIGFLIASFFWIIPSIWIFIKIFWDNLSSMNFPLP